MSLALVVSGCSFMAEKAIESVTDSDVEIDGSSISVERPDGESMSIDEDSVSITNDDGATLEAGAGASRPETMPDDVPTPPGATLISSLTDGSGWYTMWEWPGGSEDAFNSYVASLEANGYVSTDTMTIGNAAVADEDWWSSVQMTNGQEEILVAAQRSSGYWGLTIGTAS